MPDNTIQNSLKTFPSADQLNDVAYWQRLLPELSISDQPFRSQEYDHRFSAKETEQMPRQIRKEGYLLSRISNYHHQTI